MVMHAWAPCSAYRYVYIFDKQPAVKARSQRCGWCTYICACRAPDIHMIAKLLPHRTAGLLPRGVHVLSRLQPVLQYYLLFWRPILASQCSLLVQVQRRCNRKMAGAEMAGAGMRKQAAGTANLLSMSMISYALRQIAISVADQQS